MKVLIFTPQFYQLGGAERLAVELAEDLNRRGIHADILSMYTDDLPGVREAKGSLLRKGIPSVRFLGMRIHPSVASLLPAIRRLRRLIRDGEYTIVETSMVSPTVLAAWAVRGTGARHVAGLHQVFRKTRENAMTHRVWRFSVRCNPHIRYYAISDSAAEHWSRYSGTALRYIRRVYNAIPDDWFTAVADREGVRREFGLPGDVRIALYAGRLAAYKGIDTVLEAVGSLLAPENMVLLYAGQPDMSIAGTREMLGRMERRIHDAGWAGRVKLLGFRPDVPRLMASSDVLVHPARIEGFGLVLAEAMATGLPVVASNVEGIPEVLRGTDSLMVEPDDPVALREAVRATFERTPDETVRAIARGRARAEDFRIGKRTGAMMTLFEDVLSGRF